MSEELERSLERALDERLRRVPVDGEALLGGARRRADRIRRQRRQGMATLAVLALVGAGSMGWWARSSSEQMPVAGPHLTASTMQSEVAEERGDSPTQLPTTLKSAPATTLSAPPSRDLRSEVVAPPTSTAIDGGPVAPELDYRSLDPQVLAYELPDAVLPDAADVATIAQGAGPLAGGDILRYRKIPSVNGMECNLGLPGTEPITGLNQPWTASVTSVDVTVTGYSRGTGATIWKELRADSGTCRWMDGAQVVDDVSDAGFPMLARDEGDYAQRLIRVGDVLVGVQARSTDDDPTVATAIAERTVERVLAANVPGIGG